MRFVRTGSPGAERPAVLLDDRHAAILPIASNHFDIAALCAAGEAAFTAPGEVVVLDGARVGAPLQPGKIVCVGLNYADHAREGGQEPPAEPILFLKAPDTVVGPADDVLIPVGSEKTDWEVELGVVIGERLSGPIDDATAERAIAGYVLCNDVSERHFQLELGGQWAKGKNCATFFPMGPYLVTPDEVGDPQSLAIGLDVNGVPFQNSHTSQMIFGVVELVRYIAGFMTLHPGDVISTGTPAGVGAGQKPERYLRAGDVMRVWADRLGEMTTLTRNA